MRAISSFLLLMGLGAALAAACGTVEVEDGSTDTAAVSTVASSATTAVGVGGGGMAGGGMAGGGGAGGQGGEPAMLVGDDTCPGHPIVLNHGYDEALFGTTIGAPESPDVCAALFNTTSQFYELTVPQAGTLWAQPTGSAFVDGYLELTTDCPSTSPLSCGHPIIATHLEAGTYHLMVHTPAEAAANYTLVLRFDAPECGDNVTNAGEECDDGNQTPGDGCNMCTLEPGTADSCVDATTVFVPSGASLYTGNTLGNTDMHSYAAAGCMASIGTGNDQVFELIPQAAGNLNVRVGWNGNTPECELNVNSPYCWDRIIHVRHAADQTGPAVCVNITNQIMCDGPGVAPGFAQDFDLLVEFGQTYYLFVDSFWDGGGTPSFGAGPYNLELTLTP